MSELQISLIAIGVIVIMGVVFFNWMQQRRYRRRAEEAFSQKHDDVLLRSGLSVQKDERLEPQLGRERLQESQAEPDSESAEPEEIAHPEAVNIPSEPRAYKQAELVQHGRMPPLDRSGVDRGSIEGTGVDYTVGIQAETLITDSALAEVLQRKFDFSKPVRWLGQTDPGALWEEITTEGTNKRGFLNLRGCLQLADRSGPVSEVSLSEFRDMAETLAAGLKASVNCPDVQGAYAQAVLLDEFCTKVDVMIGINIISMDNSVFTGAKIRVLAEASGLKLGAEGVFNYRDENGSVLFSLGNYESPPFLASSIRTLTTRGITFLLDVPRVANGETAFGQMMHLSKVFADTLGGILVDDNRVPLSDAGIGKIKQQLSAIQSMMLAQNIPAGGETARRLFA